MKSTSSDGLLALQWQDKRKVTMISTIHDDSMVSKRRRTRLAEGGIEEIMKPEVMNITHTWEVLLKVINNLTTIHLLIVP